MFLSLFGTSVFSSGVCVDRELGSCAVVSSASLCINVNGTYLANASAVSQVPVCAPTGCCCYHDASSDSLLSSAALISENYCQPPVFNNALWITNRSAQYTQDTCSQLCGQVNGAPPAAIWNLSQYNYTRYNSNISGNMSNISSGINYSTAYNYTLPNTTDNGAGNNVTCTDTDGGWNPTVAGFVDSRVDGVGQTFTDECVSANGGHCGAVEPSVVVLLKVLGFGYEPNQTVQLTLNKPQIVYVNKNNITLQVVGGNVAEQSFVLHIYTSINSTFNDTTTSLRALNGNIQSWSASANGGVPSKLDFMDFIVESINVTDGSSCGAVAEGYCDGNSVSNILMQCGSGICENGACVIQNLSLQPSAIIGSCVDSDAGFDIYNAGTVTFEANGITQIYPDQCDGNSSLVEYWCSGVTYDHTHTIPDQIIPTYGPVYEVEQSCSNGCKDGACIMSSDTITDVAGNILGNSSSVQSNASTISSLNETVTDSPDNSGNATIVVSGAFNGTELDSNMTTEIQNQNDSTSSSTDSPIISIWHSIVHFFKHIIGSNSTA